MAKRGRRPQADGPRHHLDTIIKAALEWKQAQIDLKKKRWALVKATNNARADGWAIAGLARHTQGLLTKGQWERLRDDSTWKTKSPETRLHDDS